MFFFLCYLLLVPYFLEINLFMHWIEYTSLGQKHTCLCRKKIFVYNCSIVSPSSTSDFGFDMADCLPALLNWREIEASIISRIYK